MTPREKRHAIAKWSSRNSLWNYVTMEWDEGGGQVGVVLDLCAAVDQEEYDAVKIRGVPPVPPNTHTMAFARRNWDLPAHVVDLFSFPSCLETLRVPAEFFFAVKPSRVAGVRRLTLVGDIPVRLEKSRKRFTGVEELTMDTHAPNLRCLGAFPSLKVLKMKFLSNEILMRPAHIGVEFIAFKPDTVRVERLLRETPVEYVVWKKSYCELPSSLRSAWVGKCKLFPLLFSGDGPLARFMRRDGDRRILTRVSEWLLFDWDDEIASDFFYNSS